MLLSLAAEVPGYDHFGLNKIITKKAFRKKVYDSLSLTQCLQMLNRANRLEVNQPVQETLEVYILNRLLNDPEEMRIFNNNRV